MIKPKTIVEDAIIQLTLWYLVLIMIVSIGFSTILYQIYTNEFSRGLGRQGAIFRELPPAVLPNFEQLRIIQLRESANQLRQNLTLFNLATLIIGGAAAYLLAKRTLKPIQESLDAQNRFVADASHELRTPLASMRTEIEVGMRDSNLDLETAKELLKSNLEEVIRLSSLSDSLLRLATPHASKQTSIEILDTVEEATKSIQSVVTEKNITIENKIIKNTVVKFAKSDLVEILSILLDNAAKYSQPGSKITLSTYKKGDSQSIVVKDQGQGIRASDLPHIFDRFYRADQSRNQTQTKGYGLGLSIAKGLAEANQAEITATSEVNKGTTFTISARAA